ncbi:MAG: beta-L-arabinofuranosidase domain-containing protein [Kiritimatiellia bacterium]
MKTHVAVVLAASCLGFALPVESAPTVTLLPSPFLENMKRERAVMEALDPLNLTWMFRVTAGLDSLANTNTVRRLGGWERPDMELRGHTLGHWLSGMAALYAAMGGDGGGEEVRALRSRAVVAVRQLRLCQEAIGTGWVGAFPETDIDRIIAGIRVWAPWYVQHKILQGLLDQHELCGNEEALAVARRFGDWSADKVLALTPEQAETMRRREFGGIGEALRNLAKVTQEPRYERAADVFICPDVDRLHGKHANTFIPKVIAELRKYELHGDAQARATAERFWANVLAGYCYAPGCVSTKEAFRGPNRQGEYLTGTTGETCCTYNLLRLSRLLFAAEPRAAIADYQERALWNHILAQPEPRDGRVTYFLPMMTGAYKLQSSANDTFWCCQGSAMESHAKVGWLIYAEDTRAGAENAVVYVNQWIPSEFDNGRLKLRLETSFPQEERATLRVLAGTGRVAVRRPWWCARGAAAPAPGVSTYTFHTVAAGDAIEIDLACGFRTESTPDDPGRKAVFWGPILLAGRLGTEGVSLDDIQSLEYFDHDYKVPPALEHVPLEAPETWTRLAQPPPHRRVWDDASHPADPYWGEPVFKTPAGLVVSPLWTIHGERYVVYWN